MSAASETVLLEFFDGVVGASEGTPTSFGLGGRLVGGVSKLLASERFALFLRVATLVTFTLLVTHLKENLRKVHSKQAIA
jgi:hypothetical protein